jgi:hypothetical protein
LIALRPELEAETLGAANDDSTAGFIPAWHEEERNGAKIITAVLAR